MTAEHHTPTSRIEIPKSELTPAVVELADTARRLFWDFTQESKSKGKTPVPDSQKLKVLDVGGKRYKVSWSQTVSEEKKNGENLLLVTGGVKSRRVFIQSDDRLLVMSYGTNNKTGDISGASISYSEKGKRFSNNKAAVFRSRRMLEELMTHASTVQVPILNESFKVHFHKQRAA